MEIKQAKLLENLLKSLEMIPDVMEHEKKEESMGGEECGEEGEMPMKDGKGLEIVKIKALGKKPEMAMGEDSEEEMGEMPEISAEDAMKKKKLFS